MPQSSLIMKPAEGAEQKPASLKNRFLSFLPVSGNYFVKAPTKEQKESYLKKTFSPEEKVCKVCYARDGDTIVNNCGHGGMCSTCAKDIMKQMGTCMMCRKPIDVIYVIKVLDDARVQVISEIRP